MFLRVKLSPNLAYKLSRILHEYASHYYHSPNNRQIAMYAGHSLWLVWHRAKHRLGRPDHRDVTIMCEEWVFFCQKLLEQRTREDPSNEDLKALFHCFASDHEVVIGKVSDDQT